jgi:radical SAM protein with 4Fe4S-binding SPASM domain
VFCSCPWYDAEGDFEVLPELDREEWKRVIERLCAMGVTDIAFTGGEPLLKTGLTDIIRHAAACTCEHVRTEGDHLVVEPGPPLLTLLSNGTALTGEIMDLCQEFGIHLGMSLPGHATFTEHTVGGYPETILAWFTEAKRRGIVTHAGVTVTRRNLGELYETLAEALLAGADSVLLNRFLPGGRGLKHAGELMLDSDQTREMLKIAEEVLRQANRRGHVGTELPRCLSDPDEFTHLEIGSDCAAATGFFVVDPSGYVRPCNHAPYRLDHVDGIDGLKDHPTWKQYVARDYQPAACSGCSLTWGCAGGCREAARIWRGSLDGVDPAMQEETLRAFACRHPA